VVFVEPLGQGAEIIAVAEQVNSLPENAPDHMWSGAFKDA